MNEPTRGGEREKVRWVREGKLRICRLSNVVYRKMYHRLWGRERERMTKNTWRGEIQKRAKIYWD